MVDTVKGLKDAGASADIISKLKDPIQAFVHHEPRERIPVDRTYEVDARRS